LAKRHGPTPVVDLLVKAGAQDRAAPLTAAGSSPASAGSPHAAVARALPLLQRTDALFMRKSGCVSCHNNTLTAMTIATARRSGLPVDEQTAGRQVTAIAAFLESWRERVLQGIGIPGDADTVSYILLGLAAEGHEPDPATDAMAHYLSNRQMADGQWRIVAHRPPLESEGVEVTATSMRALQIYAPKTQRAEYDKAIKTAAAWLRKVDPRTTESRAFQLLGLAWSGMK
jgi:hypothetical protein